MSEKTYDACPSCNGYWTVWEVEGADTGCESNREYCRVADREAAEKIAAALNAAERSDAERKLLEDAKEFADFMRFVVRGEPALAFHASARAKCNRAEDWCKRYAALQAEEDRG